MIVYLFFGFACITTGAAAGGLLALIYAAAATSRGQERMQRKVAEAREQAWRLRRHCRDAHGGGRASGEHRQTW